MHVKISVCIVAYKNYDDVKKAIATLEKYTAKDIFKKVYVVDNGAELCNEDTVKSFKSYISQYSDVEYIDPGENLGFGKGHNFVLKKIDSVYHAIVNPDIIFCEDALTSIVSYMDSHQDIGMVIPNIVDENGERQLVYRNELTVFDMFARFFCRDIFKERVKRHTLQDMDYTKPFQVPFGQGSFLVIRSSLFKTIGGFDEKYFMYVEDADLCKRVNSISRLMYYPNAKVIHKWEKGSHTSKTLFKYHLQSMIYYFKKWGIRWF